MIAALLAQTTEWVAPEIDWFALAPEIILAIGINIVLALDLQLERSKQWITASVAGLVLLAAFIPVIALAVSDDGARSLFDGRYVVDNYALVIKALFLLVGYVVVLMSQNELDEHGYYQGEYYVLMLVSVLGMVMMASSRDLISIFVALETLSIPAYMMAAWNKRSRKSNEAGIKYYLLGVFASAVLMFGMSYLYGTTGTTLLSGIGSSLSDGGLNALQIIAVVFVITGFSFKVSAVPFHQWAPDTYEGAPTPVTAYLSVASKAAGFVALINVLFIALYPADDIYGPMIWVLAALTMTIGNLLALRQTNIVRLLAYSSVSQGGFILMPLAVMGHDGSAGPALKTVVTYLIIYAFSNLGAFSVVIAVARRTNSGEISSLSGLFNYSPLLAVMMTVFFASFVGLPPFGLWYAKFQAFTTVITAGTAAAYVLAVIAAINTVISAAYYMNVLRVIWMKSPPDGADQPIAVQPPIRLALAICSLGTVVLGLFPYLVARFADLSDLAAALGG